MITRLLIRDIAEKHGLKKELVKLIVDDFLSDIVNDAAGGSEVVLPRFGIFRVKKTPEREGRNPASGEKIKIAASRRLTFSPAKAVKVLLNG